MARSTIESARDWAPRPVRDRLPGRPSGPIDTIKAEIRHRRRQRRLRLARRRMTYRLTSRGTAMRQRMPSAPSISMPSMPTMPSMPSMPSPPSVSMPRPAKSRPAKSGATKSRPAKSRQPARRRRRRRSSGLLGDIGMLLGAGAGYVLGTRAGRERYQQLVDQSKQLMGRKDVQDAATKGRDRVASGVDRAAGQAGERLKRARERRTGGSGSSGGSESSGDRATSEVTGGRRR